MPNFGQVLFCVTVFVFSSLPTFIYLLYYLLISLPFPGQAAAMERFRSTASSSNPFAAAAAAPEPAKEETPNILDLFGKILF